MKSFTIIPWCAAAFFLVACSGKAIVDPPVDGTGGSTTSPSSTGTGAGTTSPTSTSTSSSGTVDCDDLMQSFEAALAAAQACEPWINMPQCTGELTVLDVCGCVAPANEHFPELGAAAEAAYDAWTDPGCGPWDCDWCPPPGGPWACLPAPDGQSGACGYDWDY